MADLSPERINELAHATLTAVATKAIQGPWCICDEIRDEQPDLTVDERRTICTHVRVTRSAATVTITLPATAETSED